MRRRPRVDDDRATEVRKQRVALYSAGPVIGGAERSMLHLAAAYRGDADVVVVSPSLSVIEAAATMAPHVERRHLSVGTGATGSFRAHRRAFAGFDLIQVTLPNPFAERLVQLAGFSLRVPIVTVEQLVFAARRRRGAFVKWLWSLPVRATVAVGRETAAELHRRFRVSKRKTHVIYNGVPAEVPAPRLFPSQPVIGCVGRYEEQKGLDRLIHAMVDVAEARLVLVGDGSLRAELTQLADDLGVGDRVEIESWSDDARAAIAGFDVFALASRDEAFPLTIVEAMLAGTPVVATDVGSVREAVVNEQTGLLIRSGDHDELVAALRRVLFDAELAASLSRRAAAEAHHRFTDDVMAAGYDEVWRAVLG